MKSIFDAVCTKYERWRPSYPNELYSDIFAYIPLTPQSRVLEIGIGTGKASLPILQSGCRLTALEPGSSLAEFSRRKFASIDYFEVFCTSFEKFNAPSESFDLIFSASAFHWIPESIGYQKVFDLLRPGRAFARFANRPYPCPDNAEMSRDIQMSYTQYMPGAKLSPEYSANMAQNLADIALHYGFTDICSNLYYNYRHFSPEAYISLLGTYSDHIALDSELRQSLYDTIRKAIIDHGGVLTLRDTVDLELARKPSAKNQI